MWSLFAALGSLFTGRKSDPLASLRIEPTMEDWARETARLHSDNVLDILREGRATVSPYMNCVRGTYAGAVNEAYSRGWLRVDWSDRIATRYVVTPEGRAALPLGTVSP